MFIFIIVLNYCFRNLFVIYIFYYCYVIDLQHAMEERKISKDTQHPPVEAVFLTQ